MEAPPPQSNHFLDAFLPQECGCWQIRVKNLPSLRQYHPPFWHFLLYKHWSHQGNVHSNPAFLIDPPHQGNHTYSLLLSSVVTAHGQPVHFSPGTITVARNAEGGGYDKREPTRRSKKNREWVKCTHCELIIFVNSQYTCLTQCTKKVTNGFLIKIVWPMYKLIHWLFFVDKLIWPGKLENSTRIASGYVDQNHIGTGQKASNYLAGHKTSMANSGV